MPRTLPVSFRNMWGPVCSPYQGREIFQRFINSLSFLSECMFYQRTSLRKAIFEGIVTRDTRQEIRANMLLDKSCATCVSKFISPFSAGNRSPWCVPRPTKWVMRKLLVNKLSNGTSIRMHKSQQPDVQIVSSKNFLTNEAIRQVRTLIGTFMIGIQFNEIEITLMDGQEVLIVFRLFNSQEHLPPMAGRLEITTEYQRRGIQ